MADAFKAKGNAAFQAGNFEEAIKHFTDAIALDPNNHVLYSNRSASWASLNRFHEALEDANKVVEIKPDWAKGYSRVGAAYVGLRDWDRAVEAYHEGLERDPNNEATKQSLKDAVAAKNQDVGFGSGAPGGGMFDKPEFLARLATNPATRMYMQQPDFMAMLRDVSQNPGKMAQYLGDNRFQEALQVGLGINMMSGDQFREKGADAFGKGAAEEPEPSSGASTSSAAKAPEPMEQEEEEEEEDADALAEKQRQAEAQKEKEAGNAAYKAKRFEEAIQHYNRALELFDKDISFLTNRAAVFYEMQRYEECIKDCEESVERGRELRADYKMIGRALTRKANALVQLGDLEGAIAAYNKALTEHRNPETLKRLQEAEKKLKESKEAAYIDTALSNEEKEKGNQAFKEQKYPEAVAHYTEALKRGPPHVNPEAYKLFSNRAACYTKLGAWNEGLKDAEKCIELEPTFAKGYSRKGHLQFFMKEYEKALETYEAGLTHDPNSEELKDGVRRSVEAISKFNRGEVSEEDLKARQAKAMADPEIQHILSDPIMRQVLNDFSTDPKAAQVHMRQPDIMAKLQKLMNAGIVQMR